ncbi:MAG TPA: 3-hydroxybutyrate dehydrogenase [Candidatus Baltobacteraceae bacterium]|nr:3-hydroxybutyrate dehydrogenase [Candidatus Baltobacteraceae bacterium]
MLKGRVAVVTGSTSGIGAGIARALAQDGCAIMLNGFGEPEAIERLRAELAESCKVRVLYSGADLSKSTGGSDLVADAERCLGAVDILVNNAGIQHVVAIEEFPVERWDAILAVNLSAAFHTIRTALPGMKQRGWGRLINIASVHGLVASPFKAAYCAAKHGLVGLTKVVALETAKTGITCNAICPGWVLTPLAQKQAEDRARQAGGSFEDGCAALLEKQPTTRFTSIEAIGALTVFLCGEAAANLTGAALPVDGAWTAQ